MKDEHYDCHRDGWALTRIEMELFELKISFDIKRQIIKIVSIVSPSRLFLFGN